MIAVGVTDMMRTRAAGGCGAAILLSLLIHWGADPTPHSVGGVLGPQVVVGMTP